jgi:nitrite reductase/ring-hydroxylating ferredoxin subunit
VAIFNDRGHLYAIDGECPHRGGSLAEGTMVDGAVECPMHGWTFELQTGVRREDPDFVVKCFAVTVDDGQIFVRVRRHENEA